MRLLFQDVDDMPKYGTEAFGQVIYASEISYDELIGLENQVKDSLVELLEDFQAEFITFESEGDRTFFQCALPRLVEGQAKRLAARLAKLLDKRLECKILFVDKMLFAHYFYSISAKKSKEVKLTLPEAGPIDKALAAGSG
jgi:hypothetical protein